MNMRSATPSFADLSSRSSKRVELAHVGFIARSIYYTGRLVMNKFSVLQSMVLLSRTLATPGTNSSAVAVTRHCFRRLCDETTPTRLRIYTRTGDKGAHSQLVSTVHIDSL